MELLTRKYDCTKYDECLKKAAYEDRENQCQNCTEYKPGKIMFTDADIQGSWDLLIEIIAPLIEMETRKLSHINAIKTLHIE
ncbi:Uncharacterized protein dnl_63270 [Desulfonema limicola]|uniref:Uncharacterized protein n=1 Tax=Desulfonema limicola TaxID=45656 RepID=A0A975BEL6_9BACT|nr:hypothetical protein [Desulfonema limicola]QTA83903.1 Uncharacterized protein dnl_63270 [Desulfonema limicola]